jgi:hypothetical protein
MIPKSGNRFSEKIMLKQTLERDMQHPSERNTDLNKDSIEERIKQRAHRIWEEEGRPEGRDKEHWDMAAELVAIEDNYQATLKPVDRDPDEPENAATIAEPPEAANTGELPTLTDTGEQVYPPTRTPDGQNSQ